MRIDLVLEPDSPARFTELGVLAEKLGFGAVWTANHIAARDPFMCFMPLAERSARIGMGPIAISPYELHPIKIAAQLATLNEATRGRARVVIGGGGGTVIGLGMKSGRRAMMPRMVRAVREAVEMVRQATSGEAFSYAGELFQVQGYHASWAEYQDAPLIYIGASRPQMLHLAGRVADGVMLSDVTLPRMQESVQALNKGLAASGRSLKDFPFSNLYAWHVKDDPQEALQEARAKLFVRGMLDHWYISPFLDDADCRLVEEKLPAFATAYANNTAVIEGVADSLIKKLVDNLTFTGVPADVDHFVEEILQFRKAGLSEFAIRLYAEPESSMHLIAERLLPHVQR